jgi:hypothetical protein
MGGFCIRKPPMFLSLHNQKYSEYIIFDIHLSKLILFEFTESQFMKAAIRNDLIRRHSNRQECRLDKDPYLERHPLLLLNAELDELRLPHEINEATLEKLLNRLEDSGAFCRSYYWLSMARIFELALFCAGHYADNGELSAVGDLLVNPRKILVYRKNCPNSLVKQRHGRLSDQLNEEGRCEKHFFLLFKHEFALEITKPAILPYLFERMQHGRRIAAWYLHNAGERLKKISDTIGFLSAWRVSGFEDLHNRLRESSPETRRFVGNHLCRFDTGYFERLGREIHRLIKNSKKPCEFVAYQ